MSISVTETFVPRRLVVGALQEFKLLTPFLGTVGLYIAGVWAVATYSGLQSYFQPTLYDNIVRLSGALALPVGAVTYILYLMIGARERHPLGRLKRDLLSNILSPRGLVGWALSLAVLSYFVSTFSSMKTMIAVLNPFYLDPALSKIDTFLHFGIAPWRITHFLFGGFTGTMALNVLYNAWLFIMWIYLLCQIFGLAGSNHRARYLLSFALCWIVIGSVLALLLSSAGPCYYGRVVGYPDPYAPLMNALHAVNAPREAAGSYWYIWSLKTQDVLWSDYFLSTSRLGSGISAMPSMHISMAYLMAFSAMRISRWFGRAMLAYAIAISIGSVHLGWHYAVDGYVSILATYLIWKLAGHVVDRLDRSPSEADKGDEVRYAVQTAS